MVREEKDVVGEESNGEAGVQMTNDSTTVTERTDEGPSANIGEYEEESRCSGIQGETGMLGRSLPSKCREKGVQAEEA